jgi:hypothetical protein
LGKYGIFLSYDEDIWEDTDEIEDIGTLDFMSLLFQVKKTFYLE